MEPGILIFIGGLLFVGAIFFFLFYFSKRAAMRRKMKNAVSQKISQFINGDVAKIVGNIEFVGEPLLAPLSGRPCAYYHAIVEQRVSSGKNSNWKKLIDEEISGKFVIRDGRDCALIDCKQIKTYLVPDKTFHSGFMNDASTQLEQFLTQRGIKSVSFIGLNKTIRYREGVLESGELVAVLGKGEWKEARDLNIPESFGKILQITPTDKQPVYLSDDPQTVKVTYSNDSQYLR